MFAFDMVYAGDLKNSMPMPAMDEGSVSGTELLTHLPVSVQSFGHKRGRVLRRWHKRYIMVRGSFLLVHKTAKKRFAANPSNVVDLRGATLKNNGVSLCKKESSFTISRRGQRDMMLSVPQERFQEFWNAMEKASARKASAHLRDFETVRKLGAGGTATVWLVKHKSTSRLYAMKRVLKKGNMEHIEKKYRGLANARRRVQAINAQLQRNVNHICEERAAYEALNHPNIMSLDFAFQDDDAWYLVSKYYSGGNLYNLLKKQPNRSFQEDVVRHWGAQLVSLLEATHCEHYVHRDIKPENIMVDESGNVNLIDFGFTKKLQSKNDRTSTFCGTKYYISPEMIRGRHDHGTAVDWWALGVLLFELVTGYPPFPQRDLPTLYDRILNSPLHFSEDHKQNISDELRDLISQLLIKEPWNRLGHRNLDEGKRGSEIRRHPFFASVDWDAIDAGQAAVPFGLCEQGDCCEEKRPSLMRKAFVVWESTPDLTVEAKTRNNSSDSADSHSLHTQSSAFLHLDGFSFVAEEEELDAAARAEAQHKVPLERFDTPEGLQSDNALLAA